MYYRLNRLLYDEPSFTPIRLDNFSQTDILWGQGLWHGDPVKVPLMADLSAKGGQVMPDFDTGSPPIVSQRMVEELTRAGVDNLQLFDIEVTDPRSGVVRKDYKAMNVVGAVSCADLDASEYRSARVPRVNFTKLVLDDSRTMGLPMFRLAESLKYILISKPVRDALVSIPLVGVRISALDDPDTYVG